MSVNSTIEWTDATWNPVRGCTKVSAGCAHCYAERFAERFRSVRGHAYERGFDPRLVPERLLDPLRWSRPRTIFVNSMSDLFHESVPDDYIVMVADVMMAADWHTYQVLTKRSARMVSILNTKMRDTSQARHVWWGVSVENRKQGLPRLVDLQQSSAALRFVSAEPLLEDLGAIDLTGISWLIAGGESGPGARPVDESWVVELRDGCGTQGVSFFFKQWGGVNKSRHGRLLECQLYDEMPVRLPTPVATATRRRQLIASFTDRLQLWQGNT